MPDLTVHEQVIARAAKDEAFRQRIAADPRAVLAGEYNVHIPESVRVRVIEDSADTVSIVLPAAENAVQDLSDENWRPRQAERGFRSPIPWFVENGNTR